MVHLQKLLLRSVPCLSLFYRKLGYSSEKQVFKVYPVYHSFTENRGTARKNKSSKCTLFITFLAKTRVHFRKTNLQSVPCLSLFYRKPGYDPEKQIFKVYPVYHSFTENRGTARKNKSSKCTLFITLLPKTGVQLGKARLQSVPCLLHF